MQQAAPDPQAQPEAFTRQIATVVFADIAGYTSLMQADEAGALALLRAYKQAIFAQGAAHGGEPLALLQDCDDPAGVYQRGDNAQDE
jgi:class 3 adenylate cyclase